jgi:TrmH family RNA methyltransferase
MITSSQNQTYKYALKLKKAKYRKLYQEALIFGQDMIEAAQKNGRIQSLISIDTNGDIVLTEELFNALADYDVPEKKGAIIRIEPIKNQSDRVLILENIQDPRNVGALFRSALAFGFKRVFLTKDCADPYHELALRSAKGATFQLDIEEGDLMTHINELKTEGFEIIGTSPKRVEKIQTVSKKVAVLLGNEGQGLSIDAVNACDEWMHIETESVESLNVNVAGAICMYELRSIR